ncbi:hypothetical protein [Kribbella sp. NPDC051770]|uniref:hypothetical protein n=1 Tax=Kribbella sp. NPDC051770 TaxID=3155413 RepID=UPI00344A06F0
MGLQPRGISYVPASTPDVVRGDLRAIAEELHCDTVMLIESDPERHRAAAEYALQLGLDVWIRPSVEDRPHRELLERLAGTAAMAEELRQRYPGRVTLLVGNEFSLTTPGMLPGPRVFVRVQVLVRWRRFFDRRITRKLGVLLKAALAIARESFHGPVSYAAGYWEQVDWSGFDVVGVNFYRFGTDAAAYEKQLRELVDRSDKPVVITEFGCGSFVGADRRGPGSFLIVNWFATPPRVREGYQRDEATQAAYLGELIDLYDASGVQGCFVFTYAMQDFPHWSDPVFDLDMAGFGVVKIPVNEPDRRQPKESFAVVARKYSA